MDLVDFDLYPRMEITQIMGAYTANSVKRKLEKAMCVRWYKSPKSINSPQSPPKHLAETIAPARTHRFPQVFALLSVPQQYT